MTEKLLQYLNKYAASMKNEVPGLISLNIIDISSGDTIISESGTGFIQKNIEEFNKMQTSTVKYALKGLEHINDLDVKRFEDIIITLEEQTHIMMTSNLQSFMAYIVIDAKTGNIALTQSLHRKYYEQSVSELINEFGEENIKNHPFFQPKDFTKLSAPIVDEKKEEEGQKKSKFLHDLFFSN